jgi:acetyltransferase-like isoleucine patch superfamily enzyme
VITRDTGSTLGSRDYVRRSLADTRNASRWLVHVTARTHGSGRFSLEELGSLGQGVVIEEGVLIFNPAHVHLADGVYVGHRAMLKGDTRGELIVEQGAWIGQDCYLHFAGGIRIGRRAGIGPRVMMLTSTHSETPPPAPIIAGFRCPSGCDDGLSCASLRPPTALNLIDVIGGLQERQIAFRSLRENIDTTTATGRLQLHLFAALAEFERGLIRERSTAGREAARARGRQGGCPSVITRPSPWVAVPSRKVVLPDIDERRTRRGFSSTAEPEPLNLCPCS